MGAFAPVAVQVEVIAGVVMDVAVQVHALAHRAADHVEPEPDQQQPDGELGDARDVFRDADIHQQHSGAHQEQCQGMADAPGDAGAHRLCRRPAARRQRGDRREMVGVERVAQSQK